ncbi:hypothetical protein ACFL4H_00140 [Candidatus Neomarinimicrobiota bacterium]
MYALMLGRFESYQGAALIEESDDFLYLWKRLQREHTKHLKVMWICDGITHFPIDEIGILKQIRREQ